MPKRPYPSWQRRHAAVLRYALEHPGAKLKAIAAATGYSPWHISRIMKSEEFMALYAEAAHEAFVKVRLRFLQPASARAG